MFWKETEPEAVKVSESQGETKNNQRNHFLFNNSHLQSFIFSLHYKKILKSLKLRHARQREKKFHS